jgi:peptidoglycan hydrolase CwlO-like protein
MKRKNNFTNYFIWSILFFCVIILLFSGFNFFSITKLGKSIKNFEESAATSFRNIFSGISTQQAEIESLKTKINKLEKMVNFQQKVIKENKQQILLLRKTIETGGEKNEK